MVSFVRVSVLLWADIIAGYALWVMMTYLTTGWKLKFIDAAAIVNVFRGAAAIMPIAMAFFVDAFTGDYYMLLISSIAYSFGMCFLAISTPPVLPEDKGGDTQKFIFYTSLVLIAVGISGHMTSLAPFLNHQLSSPDLTLRKCNPCRLLCQFHGLFAVMFLPIIGGIVLPYIPLWSVRFGIPAVFTVVATLLFMSGARSYEHTNPKGTPLTTVLRVFIASASKMLHPLPQDANQLFEKQRDLPQPHTNNLRCLDKAAIVVSTQTLEQQDQNRWKLCTVTEVEQTKKIVRRIPMWISLIMCGVVTSIGGTYFLEQANHMNRKIIGPIKVPLPILLVFYDSAKVYSTKFYDWLANKSSLQKKYQPPFGIGVAMLISILCCITASKVETRRLESGFLPDELPNEISRMSMFWLLPQFLLLGSFDGISRYNIDSFFKDQVPVDDSSSKDTIPANMIRSCLNYTFNVLGLGFMGGVLSVYVVTHGILGLGYICGVLSVFVVGKISGIGGESWFQHSINKSRLDNYYWTLAVLSSVNLVFYTVSATRYAYKDPPMKEDINIEEAKAEESGVQGDAFIRETKRDESVDVPNEGDGRCCCFCGGGGGQ